jgi:hypothetical protein
VESLMRPMNMATPKQVAALRRTAKKSAKAPAVSKRKPKSGWKSERLIEQRYSSPEPGIHILDVPCYLWSPNEVLGLLDEKCPIEVARTKKRLMNRDKAAASQAVLGSLARFLPKHCLDTSLRGQFKRVVLSRVSRTHCADGSWMVHCCRSRRKLSADTTQSCGHRSILAAGST